MTRESKIEKHLVDEMDRLGGEAIKHGQNGLPDRICVFPSGKIVWVELKRYGKKPRPQQVRRTNNLKRCNQTCVVIDSRHKVDRFIDYSRKKGWFNYGGN